MSSHCFLHCAWHLKRACIGICPYLCLVGGIPRYVDKTSEAQSGIKDNQQNALCLNYIAQS